MKTFGKIKTPVIKLTFCILYGSEYVPRLEPLFQGSVLVARKLEKLGFVHHRDNAMLFHRFYGITRDDELFYIQVKENNKTGLAKD